MPLRFDLPTKPDTLAIALESRTSYETCVASLMPNGQVRIMRTEIGLAELGEIHSEFRKILTDFHSKEEQKMRPVVIESPFAGEEEMNLHYVRQAMRDCLMRGEAPYASHALYTQPGVLNDKVPAERRLGMRAGFYIGDLFTARVVYVDRGVSDGMKRGIARAKSIGQKIEYRSLTSQDDPSKIQSDWEQKMSDVVPAGD